MPARGSRDKGAAVLPDADWQKRLRTRVMGWYRQHPRELAWRPSRSLYHVWVSEIMLQQTQIGTVGPYFRRFIKQFPDCRTLAQAKESQVLRVWEGLGYYRRALQLHAAAQQIMRQHDGELPRTYADWLALPGIGRYTAGAILSIALDQRQPILEANTVRLFSRLLAHRDRPTTAASQKRLWAFAESILPKRKVGDFNQALMEIGREVCRPRAPECEECPLGELCAARRQKIVEQIPPAKKVVYEEVDEVVLVIRREQSLLLRLRLRGERWAGMWDFPRFVESSPNAQTKAQRSAIERKAFETMKVDVRLRERLLQLKHGVTRFRITLHCYEADLLSETAPLPTGYRWFSEEDLRAAPLSVSGRKISRAVLP